MIVKDQDTINLISHFTVNGDGEQGFAIDRIEFIFHYKPVGTFHVRTQKENLRFVL